MKILKLFVLKLSNMKLMKLLFKKLLKLRGQRLVNTFHKASMLVINSIQ